MIIPCKACGKTPKPERDNETGGWLMSCSGMGHYIGGPGDTQQGDVRAVRMFSRHAKVETVLKYDDARSDMAGEVASMVADSISRREQ